MGFASEIDHVANSKQFHDSQCDHNMDLDAKGSHITMSTIIASQSNWFHSFELVFFDTKSSKAWFSYLKTCGVGNMPCKQHCEVFVDVTHHK